MYCVCPGVDGEKGVMFQPFGVYRETISLSRTHTHTHNISFSFLFFIFLLLILRLVCYFYRGGGEGILDTVGHERGRQGWAGLGAT